MTYRNAQIKNTGNDQGDVYKYFVMNIANLVQKNGGAHNFNWKTFECFNCAAPFAGNQKTHVHLTTDRFNMTEMDKSFI